MVYLILLILCSNDNNIKNIKDISFEITSSKHQIFSDRSDSLSFIKEENVNENEIEFLESFISLNVNELDLIYKSIDQILSKDKNIYIVLLNKLNIAINEITKIKKSKTISLSKIYLSLIKLNFTSDNIKEMKINRRKIYRMFSFLQKIKTVYLPIIRGNIHLQISPCNFFLYDLAIDIMTEILEILCVNFKYTNVEYYFDYYIEYYKFFTKNMKYIFNNIPLLEIFQLFNECLNCEFTKSKIEGKDIKCYLQRIIKYLKGFCSNINTFCITFSERSQKIVEIINNAKKNIYNNKQRKKRHLQ